MKLSYYTILFIIIIQASQVFAQQSQSKVITLKPKKDGAFVEGQIIREVPDIDYSDLTEKIKKVQKQKVSDAKASPESSTGFQPKAMVQAKDFMIVTANPIATQAGYDILERGGTAADAAFAAQLVLGLVEPQSSGLGGGGFALYWDAKTKSLKSYDGRETAPMSVTERIFLRNGKPMDFHRAATGGRAVGVPGLPALLDKLYKEHGSIPRNDIFQPAFELSKYGFIASDRLVKLIDKNKEHFRFFKSVKKYFLKRDGSAISINQNVKNPDYNSVLFDFKVNGSKIFYNGNIANDIIATVNEAWHNPGKMKKSDFTSYEVIVRDPVCGTYHSYKVCSMGEPSSGGLTLIQALKLLERFDLNQYDSSNTKVWHLISEASRMAFADRNKYMADPDKVETPGTQLINPAYVAVRSSLIQEDKALEKITAGKFPSKSTKNSAPDNKIKNTGTTHISAIDKYGNAISLTSSIESAFGAKIMTHGFLLNNQLTDFSFIPEIDGQKIANRAEGGKRPRSSMSPVIVFDKNDKPVLIIGSAGGSRIIGYVLQRLISVLDWEMPLDEALNMPNVINRGKAIEIETSKQKLPFDPAILEELGHDVKRPEMNSGLTAIQIKDDTIFGVADPRREGIAMGQ